MRASRMTASISVHACFVDSMQICWTAVVRKHYLDMLEEFSIFTLGISLRV